MWADRFNYGFRAAQTESTEPADPVADATPPGDPCPITLSKAAALTLGITQHFRSRTPATHLLWLRQINNLRPEMLGKSSAVLAEKLADCRKRVHDGRASLLDVLPEVFAMVREASRKTIGKEPYDVQLLGAMALGGGAGLLPALSALGCAPSFMTPLMAQFRGGDIAQMATGEGKTLVIPLVAVLLSLRPPPAGSDLVSRTCHVMTIDPYLASQGLDETKPIYEALGLRARLLDLGQTHREGQEALGGEITYGALDAFIFRWLEDQDASNKDGVAIRDMNAFILDEVDLIELVRSLSPFRLAGPEKAKADSDEDDNEDEEAAFVDLADAIARRMDPRRKISGSPYLEVDDESAGVKITEKGLRFLERATMRMRKEPSEKLWAPAHAPLINAIYKAVHAHHVLRLNEEYIDSSRDLTLVSADTGHPQPMSRWTDGLMEAVLKKEGKEAKSDQILRLMISLRNYLRMYDLGGGLSGTARRRRKEFREIWNQKVYEIPTHKPVLRKLLEDSNDLHPAVAAFAAVDEIVHVSSQGRPVWITTASVDASRRMSARLADPIMLFTDVALSSPHLFKTALGILEGGGALRESISDEAIQREDLRELRREELHALMTSDRGGREEFATYLDEKGLPASELAVQDPIVHQTLNARNPEDQAELVECAGRRGSITVVTQMGARGVDIPVPADILALGGLHLVCLERNDDADQDQQVEGRPGRQGKDGSVRFYNSAWSEVLRKHLPPERYADFVDSISNSDARPPPAHIGRKFKKAIRYAQEAKYEKEAETRRWNAKFDDVTQKQWEAILAERKRIMGVDPLEEMAAWLDDVTARRFAQALSPIGKIPDEWHAQDVQGFVEFHRQRNNRLPMRKSKLMLEFVSPGAGDLVRGPIPIQELDLLLRQTLDRAVAETKANLAVLGGTLEDLQNGTRELMLGILNRSWATYLDRDREEMVMRSFAGSAAKKDPQSTFRTLATDAFFDMIASSRLETMMAYIEWLDELCRAGKKRARAATER